MADYPGEYTTYGRIRIAGAGCTAVAAVSWIVERSTGRPNFVSSRLGWLASDGNYLVLGLAVLAGIHFGFLQRLRQERSPQAAGAAESGQALR